MGLPRRTFDRIQASRRRSSLALLLLLAAFYFLAFGFLWLMVKALFFMWLGRFLLGWGWWSVRESLMVGGVALGAALLHWFGSVSAGVDRILASLSAVPPDSKDRYHRALMNTAEEMKLAAGLDDVRVVVVPALDLNAFSVTDLAGRAVIGVTEGLVSRLSRGQLQGVVAHEMAHLKEGDSMLVTAACSLFGVFAQMLAGVRSVMEEEPRAAILFPVVWFLTLGAYFLNVLVSRQREYLADATAVELTRDPVALAEALHKIGRGWRGGGFARQEMAPIFIVNPGVSRLDEAAGVMADLFSTHPPLRSRIRALLGMAHTGWSVLEKRLAEEERMKAVPAGEPSPSSVPVLQSESASGPLWIAYREGDWRGPFSAGELLNQSWLTPRTWVAQAGSKGIVPALEVPELMERLFGGKTSAPAKGTCPACRLPLGEREYEGIMVRECSSCGGILLERGQDYRILAREEETFSEVVRRQADILRSRDFLRPKKVKTAAPKVIFAYRCPVCGRSMRRQIYSYQYFVEVDRCSECGLTWFDKDELEVLQVLVEDTRRRPPEEPR